MRFEKYLAGFDEINRLLQESEREGRKFRLDDFEDFLIEAYLLGYFDVADYLLVHGTPPLVDFLSFSYEGITVADKFKEYTENEDKESLKRLMESQYHQAYNMGSFSAAEQGGATKKTWVTMLDNKVRYTHELLEGSTIPIADRFWTIDGDSALYPGDFAGASNNAFCRCTLIYT